MFSQTTEYALRAMACMASKPDELMPTPTLAKLAHVPPNYLAKVLQQLAAAGLITGRRGVGGGYRLNRAPAEISLLEIINAIGELKRVCDCPLGLPVQNSDMCPLHRLADAAAAAVIDIYKRNTLIDLVHNGNANQPLCSFNGVNITVSAERGHHANGEEHPV